VAECAECGEELGPEAEHTLCGACADTNLVEAFKERGEEVERWATCPLCGGSGRCFFCSPGGPCYHCSGSGREMPGSEDECHYCGGAGSVDKGCEMCGYTRKCKHCSGTGKIPAMALDN
jgi:DnaJ-class molecular chaperone